MSEPRKPDPPAPRPKRGRPRTAPDGAYVRSHFATKAEHSAITAMLRRLRKRTAQEQITTA